MNQRSIYYRSKGFWGWALVIVGVLCLFGQNTIIKIEGEIAPSSVEKYHQGDADLSYSTRLPLLLAWFSDTEKQPTSSDLQVFQNGRLLERAHSVHDQIARLGDGRYSHWGRYLIFSTVGNVPPQSADVIVSYVYPYRLLPQSNGLVALFLVPGLLLLSLAKFPPAYGRVVSVLGINAAITTVGILALLAVVEVYMRFDVPEPQAPSDTTSADEFVPPFTQPVFPSIYRPGIGYTFEPGSTIKHTNGYDFWTVTPANEWGFADRPIPALSEANNSCHVTFIGDSFVEAIQVPIDKKVQVLVEEAARSSMPELDITTSAFGFSGTGQISQIPYYEKFAAKLNPRLIVLVIVSNDFANNSSVLEGVRNGWHPTISPRPYVARDASGELKFVPDSPEYGGHLLSSPQSTLTRRLLGRFKVYQWLEEQLVYQQGLPQQLVAHRVEQILSFDTGEVEMGGLDEVLNMADIDLGFEAEEITPVFKEALNAFEFGLKWFKEEARQSNAQVVLLASHSMENMPKGADYLRKISKELDIPLIQQVDGYQGEGTQLTDLNFAYDGHWNELGHQVSADLITDYISSNRSICN